MCQMHMQMSTLKAVAGPNPPVYVDLIASLRVTGHREK